MIIECVSKLGKKIRLTETQWAHIRGRHRELDSQLDKMETTLMDPERIYYSPKEENYQYCKLFTDTPVGRKHLLLVVKHLNGDGFIVTAFFVERIREMGKEVVYGQADSDQL